MGSCSTPRARAVISGEYPLLKRRGLPAWAPGFALLAQGQPGAVPGKSCLDSRLPGPMGPAQTSGLAPHLAGARGTVPQLPAPGFWPEVHCHVTWALTYLVCLRGPGRVQLATT